MVPNNDVKYTTGLGKRDDLVINFNFVKVNFPKHKTIQTSVWT